MSNKVTITEFQIPKDVHGGLSIIHDSIKEEYYISFRTEHETVYIPISKQAYIELLNS